MLPSSQAAASSPFRIEGPQTIASVEGELAALEAGPPSRLLIPNKPKKWWLGGEAALIQLLVTWGQRNPDATLVTHIQEQEDPVEQLTNLVGRPFGFVANWMAREVTDRKGARLLKAMANRLSEAEIDRMWQGRRSVFDPSQPTLWRDQDGEPVGVPGWGDRVFLASVDHHPRWRIPQCYFASGKVRQRDDFVALADAMAKRATSGRGGSPVTAEVRTPLGSIVHELFKNTHEWARTDREGVPFRRSVRGLLAQGHTWAEPEVADVAEGSPPLGKYLQDPAVLLQGGRARFLELSIFDSGIGLAQRWLASDASSAGRADVSLEEEYRACSECFLRWNTSSRSPHKGLGLHEVMQMLSTLGGFIRVRTGRLSLYRDFLSRPYTEARSGGQGALWDWASQSDKLTAMASVEGVLYTMLIPIPSRN